MDDKTKEFVFDLRVAHEAATYLTPREETKYSRAANLIEQQAREIERLKTDATRYQWLSDRFVGADFEWNADESGEGGITVLCIRVDGNSVVFGDLALTVDAAIEAGKEGGT